jgi:hypothetical protein
MAREALARHNLNPYLVAMHGESSGDARAAATRRWRAKAPSVIIGTLDAWGVGRDGLQCADRFLVAHIPWTSGALIQLEGRADRYDADFPDAMTTFEYLVPQGTVMQEILDRVIHKAEMVAQVSDGDENEKLAKGLTGLPVTEEQREAAMAAFALRLLENDAEVESSRLPMPKKLVRNLDTLDLADLVDDVEEASGEGSADDE